MQMNVCLVHVRISVAPGRDVPEITFKSDFLQDDSTHQSYNSLAELHVNTLAGMEYPNISPMKPSKSKAEQPKDIILVGMSDAEKKEVASKLRGRRNFREIAVETYDLTEEIIDEVPNELNEYGDNATEDLKKIGDSAKKYLRHLSDSDPKKAQGKNRTRKNMISEEDATDRKSYAEAVTVTTQELLRRSSNSISSSKDDHELSEILHMSAAVASATTSRPSSSLDRFTPTSRVGSDVDQAISPGMQITKVPFFSGNPAVEITHGIIHLYKTNYMMPVDEDLPPPATKTLCMLAVPATIDAHTILEFTAAFCDTITRLRIIRDRTPSQYMALVTFASEKAASNFYHTYNGVPYSSLTQDEVCRLAFVASVEALPSLHDTTKLTSDGSTGLLPIPDSTELPDCILCLERMDESVRGVLTILCNHAFHGSCLQKWEDLCCPVCRYIQTPEPRSNNKCLICGSVEDLWICLICGNVGCGRYTTEHAQQHYLETHHNYAMALNDNRVWDYAGDYFVHRLFQNKDDGKLIEQKGPDGEDRECKIEAIQLECMYLLTSQLDSQRKYWEEKLSRVEERAAVEQEAAQAQIEQTASKCRQLDDKLSTLEKERFHFEKKNQQISVKYAASLRELSTEKELNDGLRKNQEEWRNKVKNLEDSAKQQQQEITDLKEQLRDLMFYLEAQKTLSEADEGTREEIQSGQIVLGAAGGQRRKKKGKK